MPVNFVSVFNTETKIPEVSCFFMGKLFKLLVLGLSLLEFKSEISVMPLLCL